MVAEQKYIKLEARQRSSSNVVSSSIPGVEGGANYGHKPGDVGCETVSSLICRSSEYHVVLHPIKAQGHSGVADSSPRIKYIHLFCTKYKRVREYEQVATDHDNMYSKMAQHKMMPKRDTAQPAVMRLGREKTKVTNGQVIRKEITKTYSCL